MCFSVSNINVSVGGDFLLLKFTQSKMEKKTYCYVADLYTCKLIIA